MERLNPLPDPTGGLFVNRDYELDLFWKWGTGIPNLIQNSYALVGLRRTGKTAILHQVFNRLFYEQNSSSEPKMPVYISFSDFLHRSEPITVYEFAEEFFVGYMRSYLAFHYRKPEFIRWEFDLIRLQKFARQVSDEFVIEWSEHYQEAVVRSTPYGLVRWLINFPRGAARIKNILTAMIIDEFQVLTEVLNPKSGRFYDLTNGFQKASETRWAPLLVSGSSISLLVGRALGGMLSGRFQTHHLKPLSREHTHDLVYKLGDRSGIKVTKELAEAIWLLTWGYPYSIRTLMSSKCSALQNYPDLSALGEVFLFELTNPDGKLSGHYNEEFGKACPDFGARQG